MMEESAENEKKKEYLKSYRKAIRREQDIIQEIQRLRLDKMFPSAVNDGMPKGNSHTDLSDYAVILDERIQHLKNERLRKAKVYQNIESRIRVMNNNDEQCVLRFRYLECKEWEYISRYLNKSYRQTLRIHGNALKNLTCD